MRNGRISLGHRAPLLQQADGEKASILFRFRKNHGSDSFATDLHLPPRSEARSLHVHTP